MASITIREKKLKSGERSLYLDIYESSERRYYEFLNIRLTKNKDANKETRMLAEKIKAKKLLELESTDHGFTPSIRKKFDFVKYFEKQVNTRPPDRTSWQCTLVRLKEFTNGKVKFSQIDDKWLLSIQEFLLSKVSPITAYHYYSNIKTALNQSVKDKFIQVNPATLVKGFKKPETKREYLELKEIEKLLKSKCTNDEVKMAFLFSCFTGLRVSDVRCLKWGNLKSDRLEFTQKKTGSNEYLPLSRMAVEIINKIKMNKNLIYHPEAFVFNLPRKEYIHYCIKDWVKDAGINKRVSFHTSRHTFATLSLTSGIDLYTVSKLLGHKEISTTQVYAKIIDQKKKDAIDRLPTIAL